MANRITWVLWGIGLFCWPWLANAERLTDPTRPFAVESTAKTLQPQTTEALPQLQSILIGANTQKAVINRQIYRQGDTINQFKIRAIYHDRVVLIGPQGIVTLRLFHQQVRYP